ncbi:hypothetical protein DFS33DRAFT_264111 [Desarmillaria ectypa]|nr:hypothetical protein DFS33DRAFT_264111 [Desarmillaria ectypa]
MLAYPDRRDSRSPRTSLLSTSTTPTTVDTPSRRSSRVASSTVAASLSSDGEPPDPRVGLSPQIVPSITVTPPSCTTSLDDLPSSLLSRKRDADSSSRARPPMKLSPENRASRSPKHLIGGPSNPPASLLLSPETCRTPRPRRSNSSVAHKQRDENQPSRLTRTPVCAQVYREPASTKKPTTRCSDLPLPIPPPLIDVSSATIHTSHYDGLPNHIRKVPASKELLVNQSHRITQDANIPRASEGKTLRRVKRQVLRV